MIGNDKASKPRKSSVVDELFQKTEKPLRMIQIYGATVKVRECKNPKLVKAMMHEIKPEIDEAIKDPETKLEALYRAQVMQIHIDGLIIDGLKKFYIGALKSLRSEIDEKVAEINALVSGAKSIPEVLVNQECGHEEKVSKDVFDNTIEKQKGDDSNHGA